jgi:hypothetical protein
MGESPSLRSRLRADLTDNQWVTVTAIGLALVAFVLVSNDSNPLPVLADFGAGFLLSLSLMDLAFAYDDFWPVDYAPMYAILWTLLFGLVTAGLFVGVYQLAVSQAGNTIAGVAAFLITVGVQFGSGVLYARYRR